MLEIIDVICQFVVLFTGITAVYLVNRTDHLVKYGSIIALIGQPAWFATFIINEQWLMIGVSVLYTWMWLLGFRNHWLNKKKNK